MELNQITCYSQRQQPINVFGIKIKGFEKTVELATEPSPVCDSITPTAGGGTGAGESCKVLERS